MRFINNTLERIELLMTLADGAATAAARENKLAQAEGHAISLLAQIQGLRKQASQRNALLFAVGTNVHDKH
jgi:hypothetical protein